MAKTKEQSPAPEEQEAEEVQTPKMDKWDHRQTKNAIDDQVKDAIRYELADCEECYKLVDRRLWLAFISCLLCGACCLYDYLYPYPKSHNFMVSCLVPYAIVVSYLTYFMMYVEGNIIISMKGDKQMYHISSSMGRFDGEYKLTLSLNGNALDDKFCIGQVITEDCNVSEEAVSKRVVALVDRMDKAQDEGTFEEKKTK